VKSSYKLLAAGIAGLSIGATGNSVIHGARVKTSTVYVISEADAITGSVAIKNYLAKVPERLAPFSGHYHFVVAGGKTESLEWRPAAPGNRGHRILQLGAGPRLV
jgi:hypothetical protein